MAAAPEERLQVRAPVDVANLLMLEMGLLEQEQMRTVLLDTKNRIMRITTVYSGSLNTAVVRVGEAFRRGGGGANSAAVVVVHNHPMRRPQHAQPRRCARHPDDGGGGAAA
ncbi:MAG: JAB domain-containing protein [Caldilineaceae bacterium]